MSRGFKIVNSGGVWEVYERVRTDGDEEFRKINAVVSIIDHIDVRVGEDKQVSLAVTVGEYKNLGCRDRYEPA